MTRWASRAIPLRHEKSPTPVTAPGQVGERIQGQEGVPAALSGKFSALGRIHGAPSRCANP